MGIPFHLTQAKLGRAIRAAKDAGLLVDRVEIEPTGKIILVFGRGEDCVLEKLNPWDSDLP